MTIELLAELDAIIATARESLHGRVPTHEAAPGVIEPPPGHRPDSDALLWTDLTLLKPEATAADFDALANRAKASHAAAACVPAGIVDRVAARLAGSTTLPICVVGFPHGAGRPESLAREAADAVAAGAREVDMVIAYGRLRGGEHRFVFDHVRACVEGARVPVKAILETSALTEIETAQAALIAAAAGANFVKTSTGFGSAGASERHVMLLRRAVGPGVGVKASGGIRTQAQAHAMLRAGANRIGASALAADAPAAKGY